jgi:hypothetical protein
MILEACKEEIVEVLEECYKVHPIHDELVQLKNKNHYIDR